MQLKQGVTGFTMHLHTASWGASLCGLRDVLVPAAFLEGQEGTDVPSVPPVRGGSGCCLQAAVTAECLHESSHQTSRSAGACTVGNSWVYFSNQLVQVILRIPPLLVIFQGVFFSLSLDFICTVLLTDSDIDARTSY